MSVSAPEVLPLASPDATLSVAGGKGQALARLSAAELPVPAGFLLSTSAYRSFVEAHDLQRQILDRVAEVATDDAASAERASTGIRSLFDGRRLPPATAAAVGEAYAALGSPAPAVAVRSSATAEDLPDQSFAGQQDTYLHVHGEQAVLDAILRCWASLWTARAISYRMRTGIDQGNVSMGVVVQVMVPAEVSGVLFTANPVSGDRTEMVVNASFGLGEAIVGGQVTPDTFLLDHASGAITETRLGAKEEMVVPAEDQGTTTRSVPEAQRREASLAAQTLADLAALGRTVEGQCGGVPQDIEWAVAGGECWLLQSRPITNLPPPPLQVTWDPPAPGTKLIRRQVVENMPDPLSPLFDELYLGEGLDQSIEQALEDLGMPFDVEDFIDRPMFLTVNGYAYCRASYRFDRAWRLVPQILYLYVTRLPRLLRNVVPLWREGLVAYLSTIDEWKTVDRVSASDEQLLAGVRALTVADALYWFRVAFVLGIAKMTDGLLHWFLTSRLVPGQATSGLFLRGFPSKTLEAQRALEAIAGRIRETASLGDLVARTPASDLLDALVGHPDGQPVTDDIRTYLERYGHQVYTLDFAEPTQGEDPRPVLSSLKVLAAADDLDTAARQAAMVRTRDRLADETARSLGPIRRRLFRRFLKWAQASGPHREEALFYMGAAWPTLRRLALELGARLVTAGTLSAPDDLFYLETQEVVAACTARGEGRACPELGSAAEERRTLRQARMRLHPPGMVPEGSRFTFGGVNFSMFETQKRNARDGDTLDGFAVSPGTVTGQASVILSPADFAQMQPDTILVCPTTTPAWTPLFAQATGLVTDIGGILAHGSIVAREYGIPAVLGTGNVTQRVVSGQRITVDGNAGTVTLVD